MRFTKIALAGGTALTLSMTMAIADENKAFLDQQDAGNSALITQSGSFNQAGSSTDAMVQRGDTVDAGYNTLTILQSSDNNTLGLSNGGVDQRHRKNGPLDTSVRNPRNKATLTQSGGGANVIGGVSQYSNGGPGAASISNDLTVTQSGTANTLVRVDQVGKPNDNNVATVTMSGTGSNIDLIQQGVGNNNSGTNTLTIAMSGTGNGIGDFTVGGAAALSGATAAHFVQSLSTRTTANVIISGSGNLVGTQQSGRTNTVGTLDVSGTNNQLGVLQNGDRNIMTVAAITGEANNIGVSQLGNLNMASVTTTGNRNAFLVTQNGGSNEAMVTINGNDNGQANPLTGVAGGLGLDSGIFAQFGTDNALTFNAMGNMNAFATKQDGSDNTINGSQNGDSNQVAVLQVGSTNLASFSQSGNGNNAAISQ